VSNSVIVTTAISTAVATIVSSIFRWGGSGFRRLRAWFAPDHRALHGGDWALVSTFTGTRRFRVFVACAPSRSPRQSELDPDAAIDFVRSEFSEYAALEPRRSLPQSGIKFEAGSSDLEQPYLWVWRCGRVDYSTMVEAHATGDGLVALDLVEIVQPIMTMANAVKSAAYRKTFPTRFRRRAFDWFIAVSPEVTRADHGGQHWSDLIFPGRRPPRAGDQLPICPPGGFAADDLRSWRAGADRPLMTAFLNSFLKQNGFHACGPAIEDVCRAIGISART